MANKANSDFKNGLKNYFTCKSRNNDEETFSIVATGALIGYPVAGYFIGKALRDKINPSHKMLFAK